MKPYKSLFDSQKDSPRNTRYRIVQGMDKYGKYKKGEIDRGPLADPYDKAPKTDSSKRIQNQIKYLKQDLVKPIGTKAKDKINAKIKELEKELK